MKRLSVRFTVRRMMAAVAIAGVLLAMAGAMHRRSVRLRATSRLFLSRVVRELRIHPPRSLPSQKRISYLERMVIKYDRAARYPWLPVDDDPPEPSP